MESKNKLDSKMQLLHLNLGQLQEDILKFINNIRAQPNNYFELLRKENPKPNEEMNNLLKFLYKIKKEKIPPFTMNNDICKCSDDILNYIIIYDEGKNKLHFLYNNKSNYSLKTRLIRVGKKNVDNEEFIIFEKKNPKSIILDLLLNDPNMNKLFDPKFTLIGISCGILPSDRLCTIIDIVEEEKIFDSFRKNNHYYNKYSIITYIHNPKFAVYYDSNELDNNDINKKYKYISFSSGKKIPSFNKGGNVQALKIDFNRNLFQNNQKNNIEKKINDKNSMNTDNKNEYILNEKTIKSNQKENYSPSFFKGNNNSPDYNINTTQYKTATYKSDIPYFNRKLGLMNSRNKSYTNVRITHPIYNDSNLYNINNNKKYKLNTSKSYYNSYFNKINLIPNNCNYNLDKSNNFNNTYNSNTFNQNNLNNQYLINTIFPKNNCNEPADVTYYRSIIPDIDGKYINVLTRNTKFKDGCKLIEYDTS